LGGQLDNMSGKKVKDENGQKGSTWISPSQAKERSLHGLDTTFLPIVTVFALFVRLYKISYPDSVVFDEVHFGGFARKYIIGRFFMDVHPPLAKMLYAVVGWMAGYDGEFEFSDIGVEYLTSPDYVPYVAMRLFPAILGILTVMLGYATLRASGCRPITAFFAAGLMTIDNALATQSRLILLDSPLLFFMAITAYGFKKFENEVPFTRDWYRYMFLTGLGLGATVSSKWVGLFTIGWVGFLTIYQLWWLLGDLSVSPRKFIHHFFARVVFLIGVPVVFYIGMFALHFVCLVNYGDGASFLSPEFQATLQHTSLGQNVPANVAYGSEVILRHFNTQGGYLHSHDHMYETGSQQQQVTLYPHKDENNIWVFENATELDQNNSTSPVFIEDGAIVRLRHKATFRRLHSHDHRPPVSEQEHHNEVSAYGYEGFEGDGNDNFRVEIVQQKSSPGPAKSRLRTLETKFKLVHTITGCTLFSHNVKLPKWAFEQQEVTCIKGGTLANSIWVVEENSHPDLGEDAEKVSYRRPSFLEKFLELNRVMWEVNAGLTDTHTWQSRPEAWPLMNRGINFWVKDNKQIYLLGNAVVWWSLSAVIALYVVYKGVWLLRWQRGYQDFRGDAEYSKFDTAFGSYVLGWALHYLPSFLMDRQLFLHHYLGSLYFGILAFAQFWEFLTTRLIKKKAPSILVTIVFFLAAAAWYIRYAPLIYGLPWTKELCNNSKFLDMDFSCDSFRDTYEEYSYVSEQPFVTPPPPPSETFETPQSPEHPNYVPYDYEEPSDVEPAEQPVPSETEQEEATEVQDKRAGISAWSEPEPEEELPESMSSTLLKRTSKVEYRDEAGNLLDEAEVQKMFAEGKIRVKTQYERTDRVYDQHGNQLVEEIVEKVD
jgi:dolichyl-phosphate-mannose-protein mannosyltransferase